MQHLARQTDQRCPGNAFAATLEEFITNRPVAHVNIALTAIKNDISPTRHGISTGMPTALWRTPVVPWFLHKLPAPLPP